MKTPSWGYTHNQFDNATRGSFKLMNIISADHASKLEAQIHATGIVPLHSFFHEVREVYALAYSHWQSTEAAYAGATKKVSDWINELASTAIEDWDIRIQLLYKPRTAEYKKLLPSGRSPFQSAGIDQRISEVKSLMENVAGDVPLASLLQDVTAFFTNLNGARNTQQGLEGALGVASDALEIARTQTAEAMHRNLGGLLWIYFQTPWEVETFFDLANIRQKSGSGGTIDPAVSLTVNPGATVESGLSFAPDTPISILNTGSVSLRVCAGSDAGISCGEGVGQVINPGEELETTLVQLGGTAGSFLNLTNTATGIAGSADIYLL
jgi:hypothetical protein